MKFVDEALIEVEAGKGGDGCMSFHRGPNLPKGGPDGGDGGDGGAVELVGDLSLNTLVDFRYMPRYKAEDGQAGGGRDKTGASGRILSIRVPVGTTIIDDETRTVIGDVSDRGQTVTVARGGLHGLGNARFKSSTNRAPRRTTPGRSGDSRRLRLELKVIADVGLLGMPNAGKSTLISRVSASKPKIADYPFTTLTPNLGVVRVDQDASFVMADIPGLIGGAAKGAGLGFRFLKHLSRTHLLLHLVDGAPTDGTDPVENCRHIESELFAYSEGFRERPVWAVVTKMDLPMSASIPERMTAAFPDRPCHAISAVTGTGVDDLVGAVMQYVKTYGERLAQDDEFARREADLDERISADVLRHGLAAAETRRARRAERQETW